MTLYRNKYRIESTRLKNWDYSQNGYYYITISTEDKMKYFGKIVNDQMQLSKIGKIAKEYWRNIPQYHPYVQLDEFIIMPDHIHGIIIINNNTVETQYLASHKMATKPTMCNESDLKPETQGIASLREWNTNKFAPQSKNLASIIRGFKIGVKKYSTMNNINFAWQYRFYDRIIRETPV